MINRLLFLLVGLIAITIIVTAPACTDNQRARTFGGTITKNLPPGEKLVIATWKDQNLWYLTRPMRIGEVPETLTFREDSSLGIVQGTVVFQEHVAR